MARKYLWMMLMISMPMMSYAQNTWENNTVKEEVDVNPNQKYLDGAIPLVDGKVVFTKTFEAPNKTAFQIYNIIGKYFQDITKEENQINSRIVIADTTTYELGASYEEWMQFKSNIISLDRTRFYYTLKAVCQNGKVSVEMAHIRYLYDEFRKPQHLKAEEWITDKEALNKKKTKLIPITGKFRRKTIDRKDEIFKNLENLLK
ncbi:MAG: DUF4468 domain-containing protein [Prevotella sp.]|nr:DUF4468 domain-containing protein [Prevotella sp.]